MKKDQKKDICKKYQEEKKEKKKSNNIIMNITEKSQKLKKLNRLSIKNIIK